MPEKESRGIAFRLTAYFLLSLPAFCQVPPCQGIKYENHNPGERAPLLVRAVRGIALDPDGVLVPGVCVGIFTEDAHKLVASGQTNEDGKFEILGVRQGNYRLVAQFPGFPPANSRILLRPKSNANKPLKLHLSLPDIDAVSSFVLED
jgi:hypothetical protein